MSLFDSIKSLLDGNGDGQFGLEDITSLQEGITDNVTGMADRNGDGAVGLEDITGDLGGIIEDTKNNLFQ